MVGKNLEVKPLENFTFFPSMKNVDLVDIKDELLRMKIDCQGGQKRSKKNIILNEKMKTNKLKMAVLFFLSSVLLHRDKNTTHVGDVELRIVDDLEACRNFPWGRNSFDYLMKNIKKSDIENRSSLVHDKGADCATWSFCGFVLPLMVIFVCLDGKY